MEEITESSGAIVLLRINFIFFAEGLRITSFSVVARLESNKARFRPPFPSSSNSPTRYEKKQISSHHYFNDVYVLLSIQCISCGILSGICSAN